MKILVTGASGFVGKATLIALIASGADVVAVSRTRPAVEGDYEWLATDLLEPDASAAVVAHARPDTILHLAWTLEHGKFWVAPDNLDWVGATLALARAAAQYGVRRFVGTGTCYEYAWPSESDCCEAITPIAPSTLYAISKDATRRVVEAYCASIRMEFAWARLFFLYGAGEYPTRLVSSVASALAAGNPARCSSGRAIRDFMDVRDAGAALSALAHARVTGPINIASGEAVSIADLAMTLGRLAGRPELVHLGALSDRPDEPPRIVAAVERMRRELSIAPARKLSQGLGDALAHCSHQ